MRALMLGILLCWGAASAATAHGLDVPDGSPWLAWSFEPWAVLCLATAWIWYGLGVWRAATESGLRRVTSGWRIVSFTSGMALLVVALLSPVDMIGDSLFWLHMVQHLLLTLAAPPLLVWSRPAVMLVWAFPKPVRKRVARIWNGAGLSPAVSWLMKPAVAWILFTGMFLVWHLPGPFQYALDHESVHDGEHISFFVTALLFWSVVIAPSSRQRLGHGARLLFLATNGVLTGFPGALMVLAPRALYPIQALRSAGWGRTGLDDQQIAGSIMWVVGGFVYLVAGSVLFVQWFNAADEPGRARAYRIAAVLPPLLLLPLLLAGCDEQPRQRTRGLLAVQGDAKNGVQVVRDIGCGNCHIIPGISGADGVVGPSLAGIGRRVYLAGVLRNTPQNMILWLRTPQAVIHGNAMPDSGLSEGDARDIAAYLASVN